MSSDFEIELYTYGTPPFSLKFGTREAEMAREWASIAHNRRRWQQAEPLLKKIHSLAGESWNISEEQFRAMAATGLIEVSIPWVDSPEGEAARGAPWEFIITSAVRSMSPNSSATTVIRRLNVGKREPPSPVNRSHLFVKSAPSPFEQIFAFDSEQQLVQTSLKPAEVKVLENPSLSELQSEVQKSSPAIVHMAGVDNIQGATILRAKEAVAGGMYFLQDGSPMPVPAKDVAAALAPKDGNAPFLVTYNLYHSSASLAPATVAGGAWASIGFQDEFDDALAEIFFTNFYMALQQSGNDLLSAFQVAFHALTSHPSSKQSIQGTSIVLWTAGSLLRDAEGNHLHSPAEKVEERAQTKVNEMKAELIRDDPRSVLSYDIKPLTALNYCLLHNGGSLFETFVLRKGCVGTLPSVNVEVQLQVQGDKFAYEELRDVIELSEPVRPCISLTSGLSRQLRERIQTSVLVCVSCAGQQLYRRTHSVGLLAIDEWENTDVNRKWLPSFVLPRDPAVDRIIRLALPFLIALTDRSNASFSGYQEKDPDLIDKQVKAIWWSLVHQLAVNYIAPPPTFTVGSQRLRSPSAVLDGNSGTCIDLAVLVAACLEYVQLRPVVFLQFGHAYTGYLRSEEDYQDFRALFQSSGEGGSTAGGTRSARLQTPWMLEEDQYLGIGRLIEDKKLVPLDTVKLTSRDGYDFARNEGEARFTNKDEFQAVYDICEARIRNVTPLPL